MLKHTLSKFLIIQLLILGCSTKAVMAEAGKVQRGSVNGYIVTSLSGAPKNYDAGFSMYVAAWPLLKTSPGRNFQTGLFSTWMFATYGDAEAPKDMYSDIEGGLGWWMGIPFPTNTPKFMMGGVSPNFAEWANAPGSGRPSSWDAPLGKYGVAQLSPWLLFPPDGLSFDEKTAGEFVGYGYMPLPLTKSKAVTAGKNVVTGDHSWTLFLNTENFKGPVSFFLPYFWSKQAVKNPALSGMLLDSRFSSSDRPVQMETQVIPCVYATDYAGEVYAKVSTILFPVLPNGETVTVNRVTSYNKGALWNNANEWLSGKNDASVITSGNEFYHKFSNGGFATWKIKITIDGKEKEAPIDWNSFATTNASNDSFGYVWNKKFVDKYLESQSLVKLPEYFHLIKKDNKESWVAVLPGEVPISTKLADYNFTTPKEDPAPTFDTPNNGSWKTPGPAAGPYTVYPGDGSAITYYWYRFADQPALLNADLTSEEREEMQKKVEKLHQNWTKNREYLSPPTVGKLAKINSALIVEPPVGMKYGYVPIVTKQEFRSGIPTPLINSR